MPPRIKVDKEKIVAAAIELVREKGMEALNARALAGRLGCSTQPVFSQYATMAELKKDVVAEAMRIYDAAIQKGITDGRYPPYKGSGMAYIRFAKEEKELFRLLFMRDRTGETGYQESEVTENIVQLIMQITGLEHEKAYLFQLEMWLYVHGIATMLATSYLEWDVELMERMLTDAFLGLKARFLGTTDLTL